MNRREIKPSSYSRRDFLKAFSLTAAALLLSRVKRFEEFSVPDATIGIIEEGGYTAQQERLINSGYFQAEEDHLIDFINSYWTNAENDPFLTPKNRAGIHWPGFTAKYIFNKDNTCGHVVFGAGVRKETVFYFPIIDGRFLETPPMIKPGESFTIPNSLEPLWLVLTMNESIAENISTDEDGHVDWGRVSTLTESTLGVDDKNNFVRLKGGQIVARLNLDSKGWDLAK